MLESKTETIVEEIRTRIGSLKDGAHADILSVSFETIAKIEKLGSDLFILAGELKTARGVKLEKWFIDSKIGQ